MSEFLTGVDQVYVIHCKQGYDERRAFVKEQLGRYGLRFEFVLDWDIADLTDEVKARYFRVPLRPASMSGCLKHVTAMRRAVESGCRRALILEDDIFFFRGFDRAMAEIAEELGSYGDAAVVYLSNSCNKYTPRSRRQSGRRLYENDHGRAADAYLITHEACRRRVEWVDRHGFSLPIDHAFNAMDRETGVRILWAEDPIAEQGSMNGRFPSAIDNPYALWHRRIRWQLDKFYKMHVLRNLR